MSTGVSISCSNCTLLIELFLQLLVFVVHILSEAATMVLNLSRSNLFEAQRLALMFRLYMTVPRGGVGHAASRDGTSQAIFALAGKGGHTTLRRLRAHLRPSILSYLRNRKTQARLEKKKKKNFTSFCQPTRPIDHLCQLWQSCCALRPCMT